MKTRADIRLDELAEARRKVERAHQTTDLTIQAMYLADAMERIIDVLEALVGDDD